MCMHQGLKKERLLVMQKCKGQNGNYNGPTTYECSWNNVD